MRKATLYPPLIFLATLLAGCGIAKRHITHSSDDLSDNYLAEIAPARWQNAEIRYYIAPQSASLPGLDIPRLTDRAMHYWDDAIAPSRLVRVWNREDADITVDYERGSYFEGVLTGDIGYTEVTHDPKNWFRYSKANVHILRSLLPAKMESDVIHETGHALFCNGHSSDSGDVMYPVVPGIGRISKRDFNTAYSVYHGLSVAK